MTVGFRCEADFQENDVRSRLIAAHQLNKFDGWWRPEQSLQRFVLVGLQYTLKPPLKQTQAKVRFKSDEVALSTLSGSSGCHCTAILNPWNEMGAPQPNDV